MEATPVSVNSTSISLQTSQPLRSFVSEGANSSRTANIAVQRESCLLPANNSEKIDDPQIKSQQIYKRRAVLCDVCGQMFAENSSFKRHKTIHEGTKPYKCNQCQKDFRLKDTLDKHMSIHDKTSYWKCPEASCNYKFTHSHNLQRHAVNKHGFRIKSLKTCYVQNVIPNTDSSKQIIIPKQRKVNQCDICSKILASKQNLAEHKRIHAGIKPYKCNQCPKDFRCKSALNRHMSIRNNTSYWKCPADSCNRKFPLFQSLQHHARHKHGYSIESLQKCKCYVQNSIPNTASLSTKNKETTDTVNLDDNHQHDTNDNTDVGAEYFMRSMQQADDASGTTSLQDNSNAVSSSVSIANSNMPIDMETTTEKSVAIPINEETSVTSESITATENNSSNENNDTIDRLQNSLSNEDILQEGDSIFDTELYSLLGEVIKTDPTFKDQLMSLDKPQTIFSDVDILSDDIFSDVDMLKEGENKAADKLALLVDEL